jgi:hypothetical protein
MLGTDSFPSLIGQGNVGYKVIAQKPYTPFDPHLTVVIAYRESDDKYVVWTYNSDTEGYGNGEYTTVYTEAHKTFTNRGN